LDLAWTRKGRHVWVAATRWSMRTLLPGLVTVALIGLVLARTTAADASPRHPCLVVDRTARLGGFRSLQAAVDAATSGDELVVRGTCQGSTAIPQEEFLTISGKANPGFGAPTLVGNLSIGSPEAPALGAVIDNLTITGTLANFGESTMSHVKVAGVVNFFVAGLIVNDSMVTESEHAGILNHSCSGLTLNNSIVSDNDGGGIFSDCGTLRLNNTTVSGNKTSGEGGGILSYGDVSLTDSIVVGNRARQDGGGIAGEFEELTMDSSSVMYNTAGWGGGGIFVRSASGTVTDSRITHNRARNGLDLGAGIGGGISDCDGGLSLAPDTVVRDNHPDDFGTAYC